MTTTFQSLSLATIDPSPTQPRKTFAAIDEMAADIKQHGVLQPVLVRPRPKKRFELVFGERRVRGAKAAGLKEIPAIVRELTDAEVVEIQIVENAKRVDIHPLEEAEAYERLHKTHGYTVEEIAAKVGKSTATIYSRLKFCNLVPDARKAFAAGKLSTGGALALVRLPTDLQKEALADLTNIRDEDDTYTAREALDIIEHRFMRRLAKAPFDVTDATLVTAAGPCGTCPHRTGNQTKLFGEASDAELCTDAKCFQAKTDAAWARKAEAAKEKRLPILEGEKAEKALAYSSTYVDLDAVNYDDKRQRTYRECLAKTKAEIPTTLARDSRGAARELIAKKDLVKVGVAKEPAKANEADAKDRERKKKEREKAATLTDQLVSRAGKIRSAKFELAFTRAVAAGAVRLIWHDTAKMICTRRGIEVASGKTPTDALVATVATLDVHACRELVVEVLASNDASRTELARLFGVA